MENQAIDRTHRIGQTSKVMAYRLMRESIEQKIRALQKQKAALADDVLGEERFAQSLTLEDLRFLFAEGAANRVSVFSCSPSGHFVALARCGQDTGFILVPHAQVKILRSLEVLRKENGPLDVSFIQRNFIALLRGFWQRQ